MFPQWDDDRALDLTGALQWTATWGSLRRPPAIALGTGEHPEDWMGGYVTYFGGLEGIVAGERLRP
jgi:hypothetical protein